MWVSKNITFYDNKLPLSTETSHHNTLSRFKISKSCMYKRSKIGFQKHVGRNTRGGYHVSFLLAALRISSHFSTSLTLELASRELKLAILGSVICGFHKFRFEVPTNKTLTNLWAPNSLCKCKVVILKVITFLVFVVIVVLQSTTFMDNVRREKLCQESLMLKFIKFLLIPHPTN